MASSDDDILGALKQTLQQIVNSEQVACRVCGRIVYGKSFEEILEAMGRHAEREHQPSKEDSEL